MIDRERQRLTSAFKKGVKEGRRLERETAVPAEAPSNSPEYVPGFVPSAADRYYNGIVEGLLKRISDLEDRALEKPSRTELAQRIVTAWDALPGGTIYSPKVVESWLDHHMIPVIKECRDLLSKGFAE